MPFWCCSEDQSIAPKEFFVPSLRGDDNSYSSVKVRQEDLDMFETLPHDAEYDVTFVDPMDEVMWVCSTISWRCREDIHPTALTPSIHKLRTAAAASQTALLSLPNLPASEYSALHDLYDALDGPNWRLRNKNVSRDGVAWNFTGGDHNPCIEGWQAIICSCKYFGGLQADDDSPQTNYYYYDDAKGGDTPSTCHVIKIGLQGMEFNGTLPESIGNLTYLTHLHMNGNTNKEFPGRRNWKYGEPFIERGLYGTIPATIGNLSQLQKLTLARSKIISLPTEIAKLGNLIYFAMHYSTLTGARFPDGMEKLTNLENLFFDHSGIGGPIPNVLASSAKFRILSFLDCNLEGTIPEEIGSLQSLHLLILSGNQLSGTLPESITHLQSLVNLQLDNNKYLQGTVPRHMNNMTTLNLLNLSFNSFTGSLPDEICRMPNLRYLLLQGNIFSGRFPDNFSVSENHPLTVIDLSQNQFTGNIPVTVFNQSNLKVFVAIANCFSSVDLSLMCLANSLEALALDGLGAGQYCQDSIFNTYMLRYDFKGTLPSCLFELENLQMLHLSGNGIHSTLPSDITISKQLTDLVLSHNLLFGTIPEVFQLRRWTRFDLSYNRLTGKLLEPPFSKVWDNSSLSLDINRISGIVPSALVDAKRITLLDGNLFQCFYYNSATHMPHNDPKSQTYECANR